MNKRILVIRAYSPFSSDAPSDIRVSNFIETWMRLGCSVTLCQYKTDAISNRMEKKLTGARLDFICVSPRFKYLVAVAERFFSKIVPWRIGSLLHDIIMMHRLRKYKKGDFDLIVTSLPQFSGVIMAAKLSKRMGIPWAADFRDIPDEFDPNHTSLRMKILVKVVKNYLTTASLVVTVSRPLVDALKQRYGCCDVRLIMNGYEDDLPVHSLKGELFKSGFHILYCGILSFGRYKQLSKLFHAIDILENRCIDVSKISVDFVGNVSDSDLSECHGYSSFKLICRHGRLPRDKVLAMENDSSLLVTIASPEVEGIVPSKTFEYIKARRPILNMPTKADTVALLISNARAGYCCSSAEEIADVIEKLLSIWKMKGRVDDPDVDFVFLSKYSRSQQAEEFLKLMEKLI